ncbi:MAG: hypothetical protein ACTHMS_23520 [Jatrophihabitans sp.]|uniref:hypothetical protein n=1 Tax=Jatrophihabitans sp. TaxID=1932789 RepID=UPI003F7DFC1D
MTGIWVAHFVGRCGDCDGVVHIGDECRWLDRAGNYAHAVCPDAPDQAADAAALKSPRCAECGTNHPREC